MTTHEAFEYEVDPEMFETFEFEQPASHEPTSEYQAGELSQELEMELAQELLEITSEAELEEFLGKLVRGVAKGARSFMRSGVGKAVGGVLRNVAKTALPMVGSAIGTFVAPGIGTAIGGQLGNMASKLLEAEERETMDEAEAEFEAARRYVRWAGGTVRNAMRAPYGVPPRVVARSAAVASARNHAPTLLRPAYGSPSRRRRAARRGWGPPAWDPVGYRPVHTCTCGRTSHGADPSYDVDDAFETEGPPSQETDEMASSGGGRWVRRGDRIVLLGA